MRDFRNFRGRPWESTTLCSTGILNAFGQESNTFSIFCRTGEFLLHFLKVILTAVAYRQYLRHLAEGSQGYLNQLLLLPLQRYGRSGPGQPPVWLLLCGKTGRNYPVLQGRHYRTWYWDKSGWNVPFKGILTDHQSYWSFILMFEHMSISPRWYRPLWYGMHGFLVQFKWTIFIFSME